MMGCEWITGMDGEDVREDCTLDENETVGLWFDVTRVSRKRKSNVFNFTIFQNSAKGNSKSAERKKSAKMKENALASVPFWASIVSEELLPVKPCLLRFSASPLCDTDNRLSMSDSNSRERNVVLILVLLSSALAPSSALL